MELRELFELVFNYCIVHIFVCVFTFLTSFLGDWGKGLRQMSFSKALQSAGVFYNRGVDPFKEKLYKSLNGGTSPLTILEVAIGRVGETLCKKLQLVPGSNFRFYPKSRPVNLIAIEPDTSCEREIRRLLKKHPNIRLEKFHGISAEEMSPVPDGSVDIVLTTEALCSIPDTRKVLAEIQRVLKRGGKYYFLEHTLDKPGSVWRKCQDFLLRTNIWQYMSGCRFFTHPEILNECGFSKIHLTQANFKFSSSSYHPIHIVAPHVYGIAVK